MIRDLRRGALALTIALAACDEVGDPAQDGCDADHSCATEDAGHETDAGARDARAAEEAPPDARASGDERRDAGDASAARDAATRDAMAAASDAGPGERELLRQACLDTINMYRATKSLPPMMRASASSEACSDDGAELDSKTNKAHSSAAKGALACRASAVAQNSCPNRTVRAGSTVEATMKQCLAQMWGEGEPPGGVKACTDAYFAGDTACFLAHGHYINMISSNPLVSCGFYLNDAQQWWMNQDFSAR
jgi:hypothetical protein